MSSDTTRSLGELVNLRRGSTYKSALLNREGPVLLGLSSIAPNGGFRRNSLKTYGGDSPVDITLGPGDLYVSLKDVTQSGDLLGAVARVPPEVAAGRLTQDTVKLTLRDGALESADYLYWLLRSPQYREYCRIHAIGVTTLALPREDFLAYPVPPRTQLRAAIVQALGALDDKIEHNRRLRARIELTIAQEARHLFTHSDDQKSLVEVARFINGRAFTKDATGSGRPILRIRELNAGLTEATLRADIDADDDNVARHHDLLFSWSGTLDVFRWDGPESLINQHIFKVVPTGYPLWLAEQWVSTHLERFRVIATDKAVTMGHIRREDLKDAFVAAPSAEPLDDACKRVDPLDALRGSLAHESQRLREVRDALLPRLVSGQIRGPESYHPDDILGTPVEQTEAS